MSNEEPQEEETTKKRKGGAFPTHQVSGVKIKKIKVAHDTNDIPPDRIVGFDVIPRLAANVFILASKNKGKTTLLYHILENCCGEKTYVYIMAPTHFRDVMYKAIKKMLKKKGIAFECHEDISQLESIYKSLLTDKGDDDDEDPKRVARALMAKMARTLTGASLAREPKDKDVKDGTPPEMEAPEVIFVIDDDSMETRSKQLEGLMKIQKHVRCKVFVSSQYIHDLPPGAIKQLDYLIMFRGQTPKKLELTYNSTEHDIPFEKFAELYKDATQEKHGFLFYDKQAGKYRKTLQYEYDIAGERG
jgi:hypothetical protein